MNQESSSSIVVPPLKLHKTHNFDEVPPTAVGSPRVCPHTPPNYVKTLPPLQPVKTSENEFRLLKIVMSGPSGVGKTSLIRSVIGEEYNPSTQSTIAVDFKVFDVNTDRKTRIKCQVWDTAGQERFQAVTKRYYRGAHIIMFVFDVSDAESFKKMTDFFINADWRKHHGESEYRCSTAEHTCAYLVANKCDVDLSSRKISTHHAKMLAKEYNLVYGETSAKTGENVYRLFQEAATIMEEYETHLREITNGKETIFGVPQRTEIISLDSLVTPRTRDDLICDEIKKPNKSCC